VYLQQFPENTNVRYPGQVQYGCVRAMSSMQRDRYARKHALRTWYV